MILICGFHISLYFLHNIIIFNGAQHAADACLTNDGETISDRTGPKWQVMTDAPAPPRWSSSRSWRPEAERPLQAMMQSSPTRNINLMPAWLCQHCNHLISPCNSSQSVKQHDGRCTGPAQSEEELMEEEDSDEGAGGPPQKRKARQLPVAPYIPTSKQQRDCHKELMRIDAELPIKKLDNP